MDFDFTTETITPDTTNVLTIGGTGALEVPLGTTAERPSPPVSGAIRYNTEGLNFEGYENGSWITFSGINNTNTTTYRALPGNQAATDPGSGRLKWNNITQISSTEIYISAITDSSVDITQFLLRVAIGSFFWIQKSTESTRYQRWQLDSIVNNTGWFTFGVTLLDTNNAQFGNNEALVVAISSTGNGLVNSFSAGTTGFTPSSPTTGSVTLAGTLGIANGGTALGTTPTNGQLLIGNGTNYTLSAITAGTAISVTNGTGSITLANTGVTSLAGTANQITASAATGSVTLSTPATFIAPGSVQVTTTLRETTSAALTAAGATQGTATALPSRYNIITTVAAATGVILPLPVTPFGNQVYVTNRGANPLNIYPNVGAAIVDGAANVAVVLPVGQEVTFVCTTASQWWTTESILVAGSNITLTPGPGSLTITAASGGAGARVLVPLDFGSVGKNSASFSISEPAATTASLIQMVASPSTANSALGADELEMDGFSCAAYCEINGTIIAYISALNGAFVKGIRNFVYSY